MEKTLINLVVLGHINSGKSTSIGHLIYSCGLIDRSTFKKIEKEANQKGKDRFKYAWIMDKLKAERERGITIDNSLCKFESKNYSFTLIDAPGHRDFIKNMITGTSQADAALLVVPSDKLEFEKAYSKNGQLQEQALLAFIIGIRQIIVAINKLDACEYSKQRYNEIYEKMKKFMLKIGFNYNDIQFVGYSGYTGQNLVERFEDEDNTKTNKMPWYKGKTLLEALDNIKPPTKPINKALRLPIQDVYKIEGLGIVSCGRVETGILKSGMQVYFAPCDIITECKSIKMNNIILKEAIPGNIIGFLINDNNIKNVKRGSVVGDPKNDPPKEVESFRAHVIVINHPNSIKTGYCPIIDCHISHTSVKFSKLESKIDRINGNIIEKEPKEIKNGESVITLMEPQKPFVCETFSTYPSLGRFVVRDMKNTVAIGIIKEINRKKENKNIVKKENNKKEEDKIGINNKEITQNMKNQNSEIKNNNEGNENSNNINKFVEAEKKANTETELEKLVFEMNLYDIIKDLEFQINTQSLLITNLKLYLKNQESISSLKKKLYGVNIQISKMSKIFKYLNNIRLLLMSRKYINRILANEVENNKGLKISKSYFCNDLICFTISDNKKKKMYISPFIIQMTDGLLKQSQYNLTLDFLYYVKDFLNNNVHFVFKNKGITENEYYSTIFNYDKHSNNSYDSQDKNDESTTENNNEIKANINRNIINNNLGNNQENSINKNILGNELELSKEKINIIHNCINNDEKDEAKKDKDFAISQNNIFLMLSNNSEIVKKRTNDIKEFMNLEEEETLSGEIEKEIKNIDIDLSNDDEIKVEDDLPFSLNNITESYIKKFEEIFFKFFSKKNHLKIDCDKILTNTKKSFEEKFSNIINEFDKSQLIYKQLLNNTVGLIFIKDRIKTKLEIVINNTMELKNDLLKLKDKIIDYYNILIITIAFKLKAREIETKIRNEKNVFTFEAIFEEWKKSFSEAYINKLKENYKIDEKTTYVTYTIFDKQTRKPKDLNIEYLKSSKNYRQFIEEKQLADMTSKQMLNNIEIIVKEMRIDLFGIDTEIDYSKLEQFDDNNYIMQEKEQKEDNKEKVEENKEDKEEKEDNKEKEENKDDLEKEKEEKGINAIKKMKRNIKK